jgi:hypothetical protein
MVLENICAYETHIRSLFLMQIYICFIICTFSHIFNLNLDPIPLFPPMHTIPQSHGTLKFQSVLFFKGDVMCILNFELSIILRILNFELLITN